MVAPVRSLIEKFQQPEPKKRKADKDPRVQTIASKIFMGSPLRGPDGGFLHGTNKRVYKGDERNKLVVLTSPIKLKNKAPVSLDCARHEYRILKKLQGGPGIPKIYKFVCEDGQRAAMEIEHVGCDLQEACLNRQNPNRVVCNIDFIQQIGKKLAESLAFMHQKGIGHFDIKPDNCTIEGCWIDYGHAREIGNATIEQRAYHSNYRSYEVSFFKQLSLSADVWGFGCLLFELATGAPLIPVNDSRDPKEAIQVEIDRFHAFMERFGCPPLMITKESHPHFYVGDLLKPPTKHIKNWTQAFDFTNPDFLTPKFLQLLNLLGQTFKWMDRITAQEMLQHPFFAGVGVSPVAAAAASSEAHPRYQ